MAILAHYKGAHIALCLCDLVNEVTVFCWLNMIFCNFVVEWLIIINITSNNTQAQHNFEKKHVYNQTASTSDTKKKQVMQG